MLAEWPDTVTEMAINKSSVKVGEHATKQKFDKLTHEEVVAKIGVAVSKTKVKCAKFKTMQLSQTVISELERLNSERGTGKHAYNWDHITAQGGYRGAFHKFVEGDTTVMKAADCMDYLSLLYCLMLKDDP